MGMTTRGRLYKKFDAQQISDRFRKREFVLELTDNPRYPQLVMFQLTGDRCEKLDSYDVDDEYRQESSPPGRHLYFHTGQRQGRSGHARQGR